MHRLRDVNIRPTLGGKKAPGTLELHANGLRFQSARGEKLDLIFANIKLAFFQVRHLGHAPTRPASTSRLSTSRLSPRRLTPLLLPLALPSRRPRRRSS